MHAPDPCLTASVYADARLDAVVGRGLAPLLERVNERGSVWSLWFVRYARRGEHLKIRLHGPNAERESVREVVAEIMCSLLGALPAVRADTPRTLRMDAPAIDAEDVPDAVVSDRTFLWTVYRRSPVSLGPASLLSDDGYAARMTAALAAGAVVALGALGSAEPTPAERQRALLGALAAGLGALPLGADGRAAYLAYHRDWLLRSLAATPERRHAARTALDRQAERMGRTVEQLQEALSAAWTAGPRAQPTGFAAALAGLHGYLDRFRGDRAHDADPFADEPAFPPLFKAFHGLANQLGLAMGEEALLHHLCLRAADAGAPAPVGA